ncbi:hypothetical protein PAMP_000174 [Pampus punctatissimus]
MQYKGCLPPSREKKLRLHGEAQGWLNVSKTVAQGKKLEVETGLGLLNGYISTYPVSRLEVSPPRNKPFSNRLGNEKAARAEKPVTIMALQSTALPLAISHRRQPLCSFTHAALTFTKLHREMENQPKRRLPKKRLTGLTY